MGPEVELGREAGDPGRAVRAGRQRSTVAARLLEQHVRRHRLEDEGKERLADVDLAAAHRKPHAGYVLEMEVVLLEPVLRGPDVAPDRGPRRAQGDLEISQVERLRRPVEQRRERLELPVGAAQDLRAGPVVEP